MDICRLNFSHGSHSYHQETYEMIRGVSNELAIMVDLSGPKIRIGMVEDGTVIKKGDQITLTSRDIDVGNAEEVSLAYKDLPKDVKPGNRIFVDDGILGLSVLESDGKDITCEVFAGGPLKSKKGINAPGVPLSIYAPTEKDIEDAKFGIKLGVDFFALSFVRRAKDVSTVNEIIEKEYMHIPIISKIEHMDGLNNFEDILRVTDGVMVARGDLGVEIPTARVPIVQKALIRRCNQEGKPVITATQMLESMTNNPRPTRAEASDVANAIFDGTDAVMLSGETAAGKYPIQTVEIMDQIAREAEVETWKRRRVSDQPVLYSTEIPSVAEILGESAVLSAERVSKVGAIIAVTRTGSTARMISKFRPLVPVIAATPFLHTLRQLRLVWGVHPLFVETTFTSTDAMLFNVVKKSVDLGYLSEDERVVIIAGSLLGHPSKTNLMQIFVVGDVLAYEGMFSDVV